MGKEGGWTFRKEKKKKRVENKGEHGKDYSIRGVGLLLLALLQ